MNARVIYIATALFFSASVASPRVITFEQTPNGEGITAKQLLDSIAIAKPIDQIICQRQYISGNLTKDGNPFPKNLEVEIDFSFSTFLDPLDVSNTVFHEQIKFDSVSFNKVAFKKARFDSYVSFSNAVFNADALFEGTIFREFLMIDSCLFLDGANFTSTAFEKGARFSGSKFSGGRYFGNLLENAPVSYKNANFGGQANFREVQVFGDADFEGCIFKHGVNFYGGQFYNDTRFVGTELNDYAVFRESIFEKDLDFRFANFEKCSDLELIGIGCPRLLINWSQIERRILPNANVAVLGYSNNAVESRITHIFLEEQFRREGFYNEMDKCYYQRHASIERSLKHWNGALSDWPVWHWLLWATCGYGVKVERTLYSSFAIIFFCAIGFFQMGAIQERQHDSLPRRSRRRLQGHLTRWDRFKDAIYFSVNTFTTVGYGDWYPTTDRWELPWRIWPHITLPIFGSRWGFKWVKPGITFRMLAMFEGVAGWLLLALFLVTLGRIWIR